MIRRWILALHYAFMEYAVDPLTDDEHYMEMCEAVFNVYHMSNLTDEELNLICDDIRKRIDDLLRW